MTSIVSIYRRFPTKEDCLNHIEQVRGALGRNALLPVVAGGFGRCRLREKKHDRRHRAAAP